MIESTLHLLKAHFSNPLKRLKKEDEEKIQRLVHFPLKDPTKPGGFTKAGEKWALDNNLLELCELAKTHKEKIRIEVHAVVKTASLFLKNRRGIISQEEKDLLCQGISLEDPLNRMQTSKKNGSILTSEFEQSMEILYRSLSKLSPKAENCRLLLKEVAKEQTIAREKDKTLSDSLLNI